MSVAAENEKCDDGGKTENDKWRLYRMAKDAAIQGDYGTAVENDVSFLEHRRESSAVAIGKAGVSCGTKAKCLKQSCSEIRGPVAGFGTSPLPSLAVKCSHVRLLPRSNSFL